MDDSQNHILNQLGGPRLAKLTGPEENKKYVQSSYLELYIIFFAQPFIYFVLCAFPNNLPKNSCYSRHNV